MKRTETSLEAEEGDLIMEFHCPCCGAEIEVMHGDEAGDLAIIATPIPPNREASEVQR